MTTVEAAEAAGLVAKHSPGPLGAPEYSAADKGKKTSFGAPLLVFPFLLQEEVTEQMRRSDNGSSSLCGPSRRWRGLNTLWPAWLPDRKCKYGEAARARLCRVSVGSHKGSTAGCKPQVSVHGSEQHAKDNEVF